MFSVCKRRPPPAPLQGYPRAVTWLLSTLALVILPHLPRLPVWVIVTVLGLGMYRLMHEHVGWRLPPWWLIILGAGVAMFGIMTSFSVPTGRRAAIAFLLVLLGLKLLETRTPRDIMVLSCIGYFLTITSFLYAQSIGMVLYLLVIVWLLTMALMHFQHLGDINRTRLRLNLRQASLLVGQALPLMVILFIFFPRVDGPLWSLPEDTSSGVTGLSDSMSPGQITELSTSSAVAFRVEFDSLRLPSQCYHHHISKVRVLRILDAPTYVYCTTLN